MSKLSGMFACLKRPSADELKKQEAERAEIEGILESTEPSERAPAQKRKKKVKAQKKKRKRDDSDDEGGEDEDKVVAPDIYKMMKETRATAMLFQATYAHAAALAQVLARLGTMSPESWTIVFRRGGLYVQVSMHCVMVTEVEVPRSSFVAYDGLEQDSIVFNMPAKNFAMFSTACDRSHSLTFGYKQNGASDQHLYALAYPQKGAGAERNYDSAYFTAWEDNSEALSLGAEMQWEIEIPFKKWASKLGQLRRASDELGLVLSDDAVELTALVDNSRRMMTSHFPRASNSARHVTDDDRDASFAVVRRVEGSDDRLAQPFGAGELIRLSAEYIQRATQLVKSAACTRLVLRIGYREAFGGSGELEPWPINMRYAVNEGSEHEFTCSVWLATKLEQQS